MAGRGIADAVLGGGALLFETFASLFAATALTGAGVGAEDGAALIFCWFRVFCCRMSVSVAATAAVLAADAGTAPDP